MYKYNSKSCYNRSLHISYSPLFSYATTSQDTYLLFSFLRDDSEPVSDHAQHGGKVRQSHQDPEPHHRLVIVQINRTLGCPPGRILWPTWRSPNTQTSGLHNAVTSAPRGTSHTASWASGGDKRPCLVQLCFLQCLVGHVNKVFKQTTCRQDIFYFTLVRAVYALQEWKLISLYNSVKGEKHIL